MNASGNVLISGKVSFGFQLLPGVAKSQPQSLTSLVSRTNYLLLEEFLHLLIFPRAFSFSSCIFPLFWQTCMGKDVTLHVSASNPAMLLYQKFGFKTEEYVLDFYDKYYPLESTECKHAFFLRLRRWWDLNRTLHRETRMLLQTGLHIDLTHCTVSLISAIRYSSKLSTKMRKEVGGGMSSDQPDRKITVSSPLRRGLHPTFWDSTVNWHWDAAVLLPSDSL